MSAREAYELVLEYAFDGYSTNVCREYKDFYMFPYGGSFVLCVDKKSERVYESSRFDLPKENWMSIEL